MKNQIKKYLPACAIIFLLILVFVPAGNVILAQLPTHVPSPEAEPVGFFESWGKFIFYVVVPVILIILYVVWRNRTRKNRKRREEERRMRENEKKQ